MKRSIIAALFALLPLQAQAMGDKPAAPQDPACFVSDKLRFKMGKHSLSIPREPTLSYACLDQALERDCTVLAENMCQRKEDAAFEISDFSLILGTVPDHNSKCDTRISLWAHNGYIKKPKTGAALLAYLEKDCRDNKHYRNYCRHYFDYKNFTIRMQYDFQCYSTKEALDTVDKALTQFTR